MTSTTCNVQANDGESFVSNAKVEDSDANHPPCYLLKLPAELRSIVYEFTLRQEGRIEVTDTLRPPALLSTCREIRNEALRIWYTQNRFKIEVWNCNAVLKIAFHKHVNSVGLDDEDKVNLRAVVHDADWDNLMHWSYLVWNGGPNLRMNAGAQDWSAVIEAAHGIAFAGRAGSWEVCKVQIKELRKVAGLIDSSWLA